MERGLTATAHYSTLINQNRAAEASGSPKPAQFHNKRTYVSSKKPPMPTIGRTKRNLIDTPLSKVPATPGPTDYRIQMALSKGTKFHMAKRLNDGLTGVPGPADYSPQRPLKRSPVGTIGRGQEASFLSCKEFSPGPADYQPALTNPDWK